MRLLLSCLVALTTASASSSPASLGTLLDCTTDDCSWADPSGLPVPSSVMLRHLMQSEGLVPNVDTVEQRRVEAHIRYLEQVHRVAQSQHFAFSHRMGVTPRHLHLEMPRLLSPSEFVQQEMTAHRRRLQEEEQVKGKGEEEEERERETKRRLTTSVLPTLNWCSTNNPLGKSVCTPIKSQSKCGSCWAFAASDAIEMAVGVASNAPATALSPQQFLDCSDRQMTSTFTYCWVPQGSGAPGNAWLQRDMKWASKNDGCDGGMTHGAFSDAAQKHWGLVSNLYLPYNETNTQLSIGLTGVDAVTTLRNHTGENQTCGANDGNVAASIENWKQAVGTDCSETSDPTMLLKLALQTEPVSAAVNSGDSFKDYKGGIYACPGNGEFTNGSKVDHAVVLVGYDVLDGVEYWIVKNSYGSTWGEKGYLHLKMDSKINCGLNIFPVVPLGAKKGSATLSVDGGGNVRYLGIAPTMWVLIAVATTGATIALTVLGIVVSRRRRMAMRQTHV